MPSKPMNKICEQCGQAWTTRSHKARTCSPTCRALLREVEKPSAGRPKRDYDPEIVAEVCGMYQDGMTVAEIRNIAPTGVRVQTILERYLPVRRAAAKREQHGDRNHMWNPDPGYSAVHLRLRAVRGVAADHSCVDCGQPADDWSYSNSDPDEYVDDQGRRYSTDPEQYVPRCRPCHRQFDAQVRDKEVVHYV